MVAGKRSLSNICSEIDNMSMSEEDEAIEVNVELVSRYDEAIDGIKAVRISLKDERVVLHKAIIGFM